MLRLAHRRFRPLARVLALLLASGWLSSAQATDLVVSAAASLTQALRDIGPLFEAQQPGTRVRLNLGASGALLQQIAKGAPVDVFVSADPETMDRAQSQGLVQAGQRRDVASNRLVVIVPAASPQRPAAIEDLAGPAYARIAIGLPASVPAGRYAMDVLEAKGLQAAIAPKTIGANTVRQALDYVARAEVDAGFVYATDAALMPDKVRIVLTVPTRTAIRYPAAALVAAPAPALAARFVAFLETDAARSVFERHGFGRP